MTTPPGFITYTLPALLGSLAFTFLHPTGFARTDEEGNRGHKSDQKDTDTWSAEEYSGLRDGKNLQSALASKAFSWITGSPADNEKLSIGKNAQFFGFVALRYQSGRAANRGMLGRAAYAVSDESQRERMSAAVLAEKGALEDWWKAREEILTLLEDHLYTGLPIDHEKITALGEKFSLLGAKVGVIEARAFAALEDSLTDEQKERFTAWRANPESAGEYVKDVRVESDTLERSDNKQLEDLYAKSFSWLTGTPKDNEIIPIGQPAQFFGFVSIRHKSGHAASRGKIAKDFSAILTDEQRDVIQEAIMEELPVVREFLENRHQFLEQLLLLRTDPTGFDESRTSRLAREMGRLEVEAARIEAEAYRRIRATMDDTQLAAAMKMRSNYVLDEAQVEEMDMEQRGATLAVLCSGCHGDPGQHHPGMPAPSLDGFWDRPIASASHFEYSKALTELRNGGTEEWTPELLDQFLENPKKFLPGTKMEFQGLLKTEDREALIGHLKTSR
ncbi:hypothetical protein VSU19_00940 [Verrucomicrobiales bacterium BCK34]|nr:hypothetical protein [Verrucomicrobiales bacterium BCK34]